MRLLHLIVFFPPFRNSWFPWKRLRKIQGHSRNCFEIWAAFCAVQGLGFPTQLSRLSFCYFFLPSRTHFFIPRLASHAAPKKKEGKNWHRNWFLCLYHVAQHPFSTTPLFIYVARHFLFVCLSILVVALLPDLPFAIPFSTFSPCHHHLLPCCSYSAFPPFSISFFSKPTHVKTVRCFRLGLKNETNWYI